MLCSKLKFLTKIQIVAKSRKCDQKIKFLVKKGILGIEYKFDSQIEVRVQISTFDKSRV